MKGGSITITHLKTIKFVGKKNVILPNHESRYNYDFDVLTSILF